jgi:hypothetical protein
MGKQKNKILRNKKTKNLCYKSRRNVGVMVPKTIFTSLSTESIFVDCVLTRPVECNVVALVFTTEPYSYRGLELVFLPFIITSSTVGSIMNHDWCLRIEDFLYPIKMCSGSCMLKLGQMARVIDTDGENICPHSKPYLCCRNQ